MSFVMSLRLSDHKALHNIASSLQVFFDFARIFSLFSLVFRSSNFWSLRNLIKQLFRSRLLDMRLVIANSPSHIQRAHGIIVKYTVLAELIKSIELHYPMIQFFIKSLSRVLVFTK